MAIVIIALLLNSRFPRVALSRQTTRKFKDQSPVEFPPDLVDDPVVLLLHSLHNLVNFRSFRRLQRRHRLASI
jgi:hypothetical protein